MTCISKRRTMCYKICCKMSLCGMLYSIIRRNFYNAIILDNIAWHQGLRFVPLGYIGGHPTCPIQSALCWAASAYYKIISDDNSASISRIMRSNSVRSVSVKRRTGSCLSCAPAVPACESFAKTSASCSGSGNGNPQ